MYVSIVSEYVQRSAAASAGRRPGEGGRAQSYGGGAWTSKSHCNTPPGPSPDPEQRRGHERGVDRKALEKNGYRKEVKESTSQYQEGNHHVLLSGTFLEHSLEWHIHIV